MAASCLFVNKAVLIHPSWLSYPHWWAHLYSIWWVSYHHLYLIHWDLPLSSSKLWVKLLCKSISGNHLSNGLLSPLSYPPLQGSSVLDMATGSSHCLYLIQQHPKTSLQGLTCISTPSSFHPLSLPWSQAFSPSHQCPALHHINPQSPLTNTLHGHVLDFTSVVSFDLDFMSVLTFNLDFALVWLWLSSNSPTLFFVNYLSSKLSFSVAMSMYSFFFILREWNHLTPLSMQRQISHLCSYSVLNATNPWSCYQAICI